MSKRGYTLRKRARDQEATRARIVKAVMELHEELGPRKASISAIAGRAGVQRLTVYRHFPDDTALFNACTSRWLELNPPPTDDAWRDIPDGSERCRSALLAFYRYYRDTRRMWAASIRDEQEVPALQAPMAAFRAHLDGVAQGLRDALPRAPHAADHAVAITVRHALAFGTWQSLADLGCGDEAAADLAVAWIDGALSGA